MGENKFDLDYMGETVEWASCGRIFEFRLPRKSVMAFIPESIDGAEMCPSISRSVCFKLWQAYGVTPVNHDNLRTHKVFFEVELGIESNAQKFYLRIDF